MPALAVELGLDTGPDRFCRFRSLQGLEYLYQADQLVDGLELHLNGYQHLVFSDFYTFTDEDGTWRALHNRLQGQPVANLDRERLHLKYAHLWSAFAKLLNPARLQVLAGGLSASPQPAPVKTLLTELRNELEAVAEELGAAGNLQSPLAANNEFLPILDELPFWLGSWTQAGMPEQLLTDTWHGTRKASGAGVPVLAWILMRALGERIGLCDSEQCLEFLCRFGLDHGWHENALTVDETRDIALALLLMRTPAASHPATDGTAFTHLCYDPDHAGLLGINQHGNDLWFNRERMTSFAGTLALHAAIGLGGRAKPGHDRDILAHIAETLRRRLARAAAVGYRLDKFLQLG